MSLRMIVGALLAAGTLALAAPAVVSPGFTIEVVDAATGRGVPLVELRTVHDVRLVTDSAGVAVFHEPGLMDRPVHFAVSSPGYEFPADGFGIRGRALRTTPGGTARLQLRRVNLAERLYRVTGAGIYRDSVLAGRSVPLREPLLNGQVVGSDSVLTAVHRGRLFWVWGDTSRPSYPLGNFQVTAAVSDLPSKGGLTAGVGVDLRYYTDDTGFARKMAAMPGDGPTWITALHVLPDAAGRQRLYAAYVKVKPPLTAYRHGVAVLDDDKNVFDHVADLDFAAPLHPSGHSFTRRDNDTEYLYLASPYPLVRVPATAASFARPQDYEAYTPLKAGSRLKDAVIDRDDTGRVRYGWKRNTPAVGVAGQKKLVAAGKLKPAEALLQLRDRDTGAAVDAHSGSVYWNEYRKRWVLITVQHFGRASLLGEVWYAEADTPTGPWAYAVQVATHPKYDFYNPKQHPQFDEDGGRRIYFEGTYTHTFSGNPVITPRYEYNQLMYRLDLADPRVALPVAVSDRGGHGRADDLARSGAERERIAFFALDRPVPGSVAVRRSDGRLTITDAKTADDALFYALPADTKDAPATTAPLYEVRGDDGTVRYTLVKPAGGRPVCRVWRSPWRAAP